MPGIGFTLVSDYPRFRPVGLGGSAAAVAVTQEDFMQHGIDPRTFGRPSGFSGAHIGTGGAKRPAARTALHASKTSPLTTIQRF